MPEPTVEPHAGGKRDRRAENAARNESIVHATRFIAQLADGDFDSLLLVRQADGRIDCQPMNRAHRSPGWDGKRDRRRR